ncbi:hypothetical protein Elgi_47380 [Paenibacillus elgii]|nr:hypothetical protein Elgi_47380 [Paenibacillus elgii]
MRRIGNDVCDQLGSGVRICFGANGKGACVKTERTTHVLLKLLKVDLMSAKPDKTGRFSDGRQLSVFRTMHPFSGAK